MPPPAPSDADFVDPLNPPLVIGLIRASFWFEESIRLMQEARGLPTVTRPQALLLALIASGERRAGRIARKLGVTRQAISLLIAELVNKEIIVVERDPEDSRAQRLAFSPKHAAHGEQLLAMFGQLEAHVGGLIGQDRLAVLRQALVMSWGEPTALDDRR